jgi:hypothetical protein
MGVGYSHCLQFRHRAEGNGWYALRRLLTRLRWPSARHDSPQSRASIIAQVDASGTAVAGPTPVLTEVVGVRSAPIAHIRQSGGINRGNTIKSATNSWPILPPIISCDIWTSSDT